MVDFNKIYKDYYKRSFGFAKSYVFEDMAAEDIASESLISLWQVMKKEEVAHPLSLLLTILKNNSLNYLKSQERKLDMMDSVSDMLARDLNYRINCLNACDPQELFSSEITTIIEQTLASLSPQTRRVFEMSRYEMLPVKEIAESLELSPKAVEYHITKVLKALRVALKDYLPLYYLLFV
ncbi:RNA polymerase sigma-70 factor [Phocaeicola sp.]